MGDDLQDYREFILELLRAEEESGSDVAVIYPLLKARQHLLNPQFAKTLSLVVAEFSTSQPKKLQAILPHLGDLSIDIKNFPLGSRANNLEIAIAGYKIALSHHQPGSPEYAQTQNNLAAAYYQRINGSRAENLEWAIEYYQAALAVYKLEDFPEYWAMTQNNLAVAYSNRINGSRAENLERAIKYFQAALTMYKLEDFPEDWAMTQNNLANAYSNRIKGSRAENLEQAIEYYQAALTVYKLEDFPEDWAMTQNNLAIAYNNRINGSRAENLERAIESYQAALTVRTREDFPEYWAMTQNNLANAYNDRINGFRAKNLEQAIESYQAALTVRTREDFPEYWAETQNNLAAAYSERINGSRAENLERAIESYQAALTVRTREDFPEDWAMTQNNLASAYSYRINGSRAENLERAIEHYQNALTVSTRQDLPVNNVETLNNLGWAYLAKLDHINQQTPTDPDQRTATINSAYATFRDAITGADYLRRLESLREVKEKHDVQFDRLYQGMVQVCVELGRNQEALVYAETNKARNLGELLAQRKENPQPPEPITYGQITQLLRTPTTALIEWYITDSEIFTFVLTVQGLQVHRSRNVQKLKDLVRAYQADYKERSSWSAQLPTHLQNLGEILGLAPLLPPDCDHLILIPHWYLHLFPLHALPILPPSPSGRNAVSEIDLPSPSGRGAGGEGLLLIDKFPQGIQYAPSCQLLHQITPQANFAQLLALQNPTGDLTYTNLEVDSIAPKFPTSKVLPGTEATKTNLLEQYLDQLQSAHCAHFSCHGFFDPQAPLKSALILSGGILDDEDISDIAQKTQEDGTGKERYVTWRKGKKADLTKCLTLADIFTLQLHHCRLAVLSACETALIDTTNRSDYIGLPTGFLHAGATGVLASLWSVEDISTALMMVRFYEEFFPDSAQPQPSLSLALHKTQLWFKSATTPDLRTWVTNSQSFPNSQKKLILEQLDCYNDDEKPYGKIHQWAAFCAIGL